MSVWYEGNIVLIQTTLIYALLSLSFQVVLRAGVFSLASVGFYGLGAYTFAMLTLHGTNVWLAFLAVIVAAVVLGLLVGMLVNRLRGLYLALFTVAFDLILTVVATNGGDLTGGPVGLFGVPPVLGTGGMAVLVVIAVLVVWQLERHSLGRSFEALRLNEDMARSVGVEVGRRRMVVFCTSAVLGACAGVANISAFTTISPQTAGFPLVTTGLTMAVLGGIGRWQGALIGAVIVAWLPEVLGDVGDYQAVVNGAIIIVLVVFAPDGVLGLAIRGWRRLRRRREPEPGPPTSAPAPDQTVQERV
ncbi:MAG TPA: branched-chain amino acid ABC transporter permease [Amycolatopsis sp.]|nr:branched-chain amino acid ABC transporter permease [Amycolatopsis sp.]